METSIILGLTLIFLGWLMPRLAKNLSDMESDIERDEALTYIWRRHD